MHTVTSADGTSIAYDRGGTGPAVILVGGAFQYRAFDPRTAELAALLSAQFTVYHYDRRGRGDSGDGPTYETHREVEDLEALIGAAGGSAYVFGMSSGAVLALDAAAAGLGVTRLALYEAPVIVDGSRPPVADNYRERLNDVVAAGRRGDAVELFLTEAAGMPAAFVGPMRETPMWTGFEAVAHTLRYEAAIMDGTVSGQPLPAERWSAVKIPALMVDGGASQPWMHHAADAVAALLPQAQRRTLPGQDHAVDPSVLAAALVEFFAA